MNEVHHELHGSMFSLLKKFVTHTYSEDMWHQLTNEAHTTGNFETTKSYPMSDILAIIKSASHHTGLSVIEIEEKFGEYLVPDLFKMYGSYLNPSWKTFDVLLNTERVMHGAVRHLNSAAHPPILNVSQVNEHLLIIDYYSKRKLASLAVGIIKGIADYYKEKESIAVKPTTEPDAERVQIRVEFKS
ncbi:MAG: hypothetical protein K0S53_2655 [Bacteroidetes bacterium]|nr:hypothetical protein [Bacteroidota bacterium]